jgi:transcriptional regulator with XRE-family HTH domain
MTHYERIKAGWQKRKARISALQAQGMSQSAIARKLGITRQRVGQLLSSVSVRPRAD